MSQFKILTDSELTEKVKSLAHDERELTRVIIEHIAEVDRRKLFLALAYSSLFEYLTKDIGYSAGAAQRRIDAARLLQRVPEVAAKIESGAIHLAQISKLQSAARVARKEGRPVELETQRSVLEKLENKGAEQTDLILAREFQVPVKLEERRHIQRDESVRIEFTFSKEEMELINRAREILSHKTGGGLKETVLEMAEKIVKCAEPRVKSAKSKIEATTAMVAVKMTLPPETSPAYPTSSGPTHNPPAKATTKTITPRLRREILARDGCCQFKDRLTGKICGSKIFLEVDHIQPRFANGSNAPENLRVLCKNHNVYRYRAEL